MVHAIALRAQLRIEPQRRPYDREEQDGLVDLFGTPDRYASTLKPFLWTHASTMVQGFTGERELELPVACTYDFEVSGDEVPARPARRRRAARPAVQRHGLHPW